MRVLTLGALALTLTFCGCDRRDRVEAGNQAERAADRAGQSISDGGTTMKVKSALSLSSKLTSTGIDVDTMENMVHLRGTVPTADQKMLAERIARDTVGPNIRVVNELKVDAKMKSDSATNPPGPAKRY